MLRPSKGYFAAAHHVPDVRTSVHVYIGTYPRRALALDLLPLPQAGRRLFCGRYQAHKEEFCHRRGVFFHRNRCIIGMACAQAVSLRGAPTTARRLVAAPRNLPPLHMANDDFAWTDRHLNDFA
jgi:hypothetical protein